MGRYIYNCPGCGRRFRDTSPEQAALMAHDCNMTDEQLNELIASYRQRQVELGL